MKNSELIDEILDFKDSIIDDVSTKDIVSFNILNVDIEDKKFLLNDQQISKKAVSKILSGLRVQEKFLEYGEILDEGDWSVVKDILKQANQNIEFFGRRVKDGDKFIIEDLYRKNEELKSINDLDVLQYFNSLVSSLSSTDIEFEKKSLSFDKDKEAINIKLLEKDGNIDIFGDKNDYWKRGIDLNWNITNFQSSPFFERLACTNGLVAETHAFRTNITKRNFNTEKIEMEINRIISKTNQKFDEIIQGNCNKLKQYDASIAEFLLFKNFFDKKNEDGKYDTVLNKMFNGKAILKAYGENPEEKSMKWCQTGTCGSNAYDFFNDLTYLRSHDYVEKEHIQELDIKISDFFFKKNLDLMDVAQAPSFKVKKVFSDN